MYRRDDPPFAAVVERSFARMAETRRLRDLYTRWFLRRLPNGQRLDIPMSPQLENILRALGEPE
jgi:glutamate/aspartate transport system substrate-binding protein